MKKLLSYLLVAIMLPALVLTGCKDDPAPEPATGNFTTLSTYMVNQNLDLPALLAGWVIDPKPTTVDGGIVDVENDCTIPDWTVFDIRSEADFKKGHVKGSHNVKLTDIVTAAQAINGIDKILVMCYSGQTAGRAVMALRLSGFPNAKVSKFGFSAWSNNSEFDKWSSKESDQADGNSNWVSTAAPELPVYEYQHGQLHLLTVLQSLLKKLMKCLPIHLLNGVLQLQLFLVHLLIIQFTITGLKLITQVLVISPELIVLSQCH